MNDQEYIHEWISRYNEGELSNKELIAFRRLLEKDPEIRVETELDKELTEFLQDRDLIEFLKVLDMVKSKKRKESGFSCLLLAAVLVILVTLGCSWIILSPLRMGHPLMQKRTAGSTDPTESRSHGKVKFFPGKNQGFAPSQAGNDSMDDEFLACNFKPLAYMEGMVGVVTRSGSFHLISPEHSVTAGPADTIRFIWRVKKDATLSMEVINNRGESVFSHEEIPGTTMDLPVFQLPEGLYYWKFFDQDNLVSVGKIILKR